MTTVDLPFPVSVNAMFSNGKSGRFKSQRYADWVIEAGYAMNIQRPAKVKGPVTLACLVQENHDGRKRDITNLIKGPEDLLVSHGIIEADDNTIVREVTMRWSREVKGIRITISPVEQQREEIRA